MSGRLGHPRRTAISPAGPHPTGREVVGTYVHSYDSPRQHQSQIPAMRPAQDPSEGLSPTPIYDALYSEYRRSFRALPGDRSGEENLGFSAFGAGLFASRAPLSGYSAASSHGGHGGQSGSGGQSQRTTGSLGSWQRVGRHAGRPRPAALPPGPRDS
ncbi:hypothetical protein GCM10010253_49450 [Streptomyces badius]|uniref:Uncharacterized protein n=2 Tax=Streptomyces badius TaxID=1941 RepID=A0ABQ2TG77_STRBA|nr:hypothetical protein GCM10010253_49450 [Streptomyces badius]